MTPRVSIIITTRNRAEHLRQTLESQGPVRVPAEVLLLLASSFGGRSRE